MNPDYTVDQADSDYLTELPNRRGLYRYYSHLDEDEMVHAMFVDIDNFNLVNDTYGHSMGDLLLRSVSALICEKTTGFASRIGGDEFVVLVDGNLTRDEVGEIAESLRKGVKTVNFRPDILSRISLSIGIVMSQHARQSLDEILARCDAAMYQSKFGGKNKISFYDSEDKSIEVSRNIEAEMEGALEGHQFNVFLQPKVNMISTEIVGAEALCRWVHPIEGVRTPDEFIPIFEKDGFISKLDLYMFEETCRIKKSWKGRVYANIPVSVNVSRLHLFNQDFPGQIAEIADKYEIPHNEIELEITESIYIKDTEELIQMTDKLRELGFSVSIDDFGSGFSALSLLKDLPVDTIKLDKGFLHSSANNPRGRQIIRSVIAMCRDLKIQVVTEGIETKEQIDFITSCSCQIAQGFYYAKPLPLEEFEEYASRHKNDVIDSFVFRLDSEDLTSADGNMPADYTGNEKQFSEGIFRGSRAFSFTGGRTGQNVIEVTPKAIANDSWSVAFWIRPKSTHTWTSAIYIKFETGFANFSPYAFDGQAALRIRDSREVNGWYDATTTALRLGMWWHVAMSYDAETEKATLFVNGEKVSETENIPANRFVKRIVLGGDIFQQSFVGDMCEVMFFNEVKSSEEIMKLYRSYTENPDFTADEINRLM